MCINHINLLGNSIGIQKTSSQGSNWSTRSNVEQQHHNGRIVSGPHIHPPDFDFVFLDPGSSCGWCYKQKALSSSSTHHHSSFGSSKKKNTSCSSSSCSRVWKKKKKKKKRKKNTFLRGSWFRVRSTSSHSRGTGV